MTIFLVYTSLFAMEYHILKINKEDAESYGNGMPTEGLRLALGYMISAFENGIGNINPPSLDNWLPKWNNGKAISYTSQIIIFEIYFVWLMNQIVMLIVLLNFIIALISDVYAEITENKTQIILIKK